MRRPDDLFVGRISLIPKNLVIIIILNFSLITYWNIKLPTWTREYADD